MNKYRLKEKAYPFFRRGLQTMVGDYETWTKTYNVCEEALEKVEECYVTYGIKKEKYADLGGWANPETNKDNYGAHFCFTIHFPSMKHREYDEFGKGAMTRKLMDEIQRCVNNWYNSFNTNDEQV